MGCLETKIISVCIFDTNQYLLKAIELKVKQSSSSAEIGKLLYNHLSQYSSKYDLTISFDVFGTHNADFEFLNKTKNIIVQLNLKNTFNLIVADRVLTIN